MQITIGVSRCRSGQSGNTLHSHSGHSAPHALYTQDQRPRPESERQPDGRQSPTVVDSDTTMPSEAEVCAGAAAAAFADSLFSALSTTFFFAGRAASPCRPKPASLEALVFAQVSLRAFKCITPSLKECRPAETASITVQVRTSSLLRFSSSFFR